MCLSFFTLISAPGGFQPREYCSVNFLGAIFNQAVPLDEIFSSPNKNLIELPAEAEIQHQINYAGARLFVSENKQIVDPDYLIDPDVPKNELLASVNFAQPSRSASFEREVLFRPELPQYPEWAQQEFRANSAVFKIYISASGAVEEWTCLQASGNPELDANLARYIEKWRFVPAFDQQGNWQLVKIELEQ
ncbi:TonB family protein [Candidatus Omnitrophota bacterium]